jgi:hypothetical protein
VHALLNTAALGHDPGLAFGRRIARPASIRRAHTLVPSRVTTPPTNSPARLTSKIASDLPASDRLPMAKATPTLDAPGSW